jgi:hypothetical protein
MLDPCRLLYLERHNGIAAKPQADQLRCESLRRRDFRRRSGLTAFADATYAMRIIWLYGVDAAVQQSRVAI